uniref:MARVEL domain containing 2 n=1 Tax=Lates calcarifer TaxID=8187 RepID=A0A4W6FRU5_LATCA
MSYGGGFYGRTERVRQAPHYDQVPQGTLPPEKTPTTPQPLREQRAPHLAQSADPLPPPPLPDQPPVGPRVRSQRQRGQHRPGERPRHRHQTSPPGCAARPPHSPLCSRIVPGSLWGSGGSYNSRKELLDGHDAQESVSGRTYRTGLTYSERVEEYHQRYAFMKSWAGLLRILGCVELLLGAAVFACVCAYIHKDNEWFNMFGYSSPGGAYGGGFYALVCLKLWRHEAARRYRERYGQENSRTGPRSSVVPIQAAPKPVPAKILQGAIPSGHIPKPVIVPDYIAKYPSIKSDEERDQYRAVFNDQYAEYKELHSEVQATLKKFDEMDAMMRGLP